MCYFTVLLIANHLFPQPPFKHDFDSKHFHPLHKAYILPHTLYTLYLIRFYTLTACRCRGWVYFCLLLTPDSSKGSACQQLLIRFLKPEAAVWLSGLSNWFAFLGINFGTFNPRLFLILCALFYRCLDNMYNVFEFSKKYINQCRWSYCMS